MQTLCIAFVIAALRWAMMFASDYYAGQAVSKWNPKFYRQMSEKEQCEYALSCLVKAKWIDPWVDSRNTWFVGVRDSWQQRKEKLKTDE